MTVTDQINILNRKIKQNEAQYDLDREAAKISAFSSNNLDKYEYLTGEDLDLKPSTVEQAKFEQSLLGKIFNKGLSEDDKNQGILKRLENIRDKNDELVNTFNTTNKSFKNKINNQSKKVIYNAEHSFAKLRNADDIKNYHSEWIIKKEADINRESFMKHFNFQNPSDMLKNLYQINDKEKKLNYRM